MSTSMSKELFTILHEEARKNGRTAAVLESYARAAENREWIDSDLAFVLRRAAKLLRQYCPEVIEHERQVLELHKRIQK